MTRIAILGGGISGLTAAYELELARRRGVPIDWHLFEATDRLGGILQTTRHTTPEGDFILEGGPDAWVSEKPWARDLALELGLESQLIYSNDATRKTYILKTSVAGENIAGELLPTPDRMRLMVPEDLSALDNSPLFSDSAKTAYAAELNRAEQLRAAAHTDDESVASFVHRHFGEEVLTTLAAPLLSGVFGGDVHKLSVRAVMPQFVAMEREHGSLIAALQSRSRQRTTAPQPIFTSLRNGMASLVDALLTQLPPQRLHLNHAVSSVIRDSRGSLRLNLSRRHPDPEQREGEESLYFASATDPSRFDHVLLATPADATRNLLAPIDAAVAALLPTEASSAILTTFIWPADLAHTFTLPSGFGFLVPPANPQSTTELSSRLEARSAAVERPAVQDARTTKEPQLLACTFVDQKFAHRAPTGARILRAFFGGPGAETLTTQSDATIADAALTQLRTILGRIPDPSITTIRRLPRSLPQYEVGHLDRIAQLESLVAQTPGLHLLGNAYHGVGLPDLIHAARTAARALAARATL
jgi:oxygen-dependent protoporphyrinogen oxidase